MAPGCKWMRDCTSLSRTTKVICTQMQKLWSSPVQ
jgi:hypothetical protein